MCYLQLFCVGFKFHVKFNCISIQSFVPCILCEILLYGLCVRESVKTQAPIEESEDFAGISREAFPRSESHAKHMIGMRRVIIAGFREYFEGKVFP